MRPYHRKKNRGSTLNYLFRNLYREALVHQVKILIFQTRFEAFYFARLQAIFTNSVTAQILPQYAVYNNCKNGNDADMTNE